MGTLFLLLLALQDDSLRVEGPPFLVFGDTVELRAQASVRDAAIVWRLAGAPMGSLETKPSIDAATRVARGTDRLSVTSVGQTEGEILFVVTLERRGIRLASVDVKMRVGPLIKVRAWCRPVEHREGGTRRADLLRDAEQRKAVESEVNRLLRPLGVEIALDLGKPVSAPDGWFDREGKFHPIALRDGKKANSASLQELIGHDEPGGLNVYFLRDCKWVEVKEGFARVVTDHNLIGIGLKEGQVVLDDAWDAPSLAHELGHALGLDDLSAKGERGRLMYSVRRDRTGLAFVYGEMKDARERARQHLKSWLARR